MFENCSFSSGKKQADPGIFLLFLSVFAVLFFSGCSRGTDWSTREDRLAALEELGYTVAEDSEELRELVLPQEFGSVMAEYAALQTEQGLDLYSAAGKRCTQVQYALENYPGWDGAVTVTLLLCRGRLVAAEVHTADVEGFMLPLFPGAEEK